MVLRSVLARLEKVFSASAASVALASARAAAVILVAESSSSFSADIGSFLLGWSSCIGGREFRNTAIGGLALVGTKVDLRMVLVELVRFGLKTGIRIPLGGVGRVSDRLLGEKRTETDRNGP